MYVVYINLLYFLSIFLFTYNKKLLSQKNDTTTTADFQYLLLSYIEFCCYKITCIMTLNR